MVPSSSPLWAANFSRYQNFHDRTISTAEVLTPRSQTPHDRAIPNTDFSFHRPLAKKNRHPKTGNVEQDYYRKPQTIPTTTMPSAPTLPTNHRLAEIDECLRMFAIVLMGLIANISLLLVLTFGLFVSLYHIHDAFLDLPSDRRDAFVSTVTNILAGAIVYPAAFKGVL